MISWLGVASYDRGVFDRYINTARRARGINMEENWGFGTLYDAKVALSDDPVLSNAGFRGRWGDRLQHLLLREHRLLGRDARPHHEEAVPHVPLAWRQSTSMATAGRCTTRPRCSIVGSRKTATTCSRATIEIDAGYLLYAPYAAVSSWMPDEPLLGSRRRDSALRPRRV